MRELPPQIRKTFVLSRWCELRAGEIAAVQEINAGTVRQRLSRAQQHIRQIRRHEHGQGEFGPKLTAADD